MRKIYVGPDKPYGQPIRRNMIFADDPVGVFPALAALFQEHKNFKRLFVPVERLAYAQAELKNPGTPLSIYYAETAEAK